MKKSKSETENKRHWHPRSTKSTASSRSEKGSASRLPSATQSSPPSAAACDDLKKRKKQASPKPLNQHYSTTYHQP